MNQIQERLRPIFPYNAYPSQLDLASQVYSSIANNRKVSIFESPTGTGKSLCLIVGALQWLIDMQEGQVIKEKKEKSVPIDSKMPNWFIEYDDDEVQVPMKPLVHPAKKLSLTYAEQSRKPQKPELEDDYLVDLSSEDERIASATAQLTRKIKQTKELQIIYCSRTHTQIKQWISEIKKVPSIASRIKLISLASRQQLCTNQQILNKSFGSVSRLNFQCKASQKESKKSDTSCQYHSNFKTWKSEQLSTTSFTNTNIFDIEELKLEGSKCKICPYYVSKHLIDEYDVVCLPYQLLLEKIPTLKNTIVIIDEAHNFGSALLQKSSATLSIGQATCVFAGLQMYKQKYHQRLKARSYFIVNQLVNVAQQLVALLNKLYSDMKAETNTTQVCMISLMIDLNLKDIDLSKMLRFMGNKDVSRRMSGFVDSQQRQEQHSYANYEIFCQFVQTLILSNQDDCVVYFEKVNPMNASTMKISALKNDILYRDLLNKCRSLILIGGTMQPLNELEIMEKSVEPGQYIFSSFPHIIPQESCKLLIVPGYPTPVTFTHRSKLDNLQKLLEQSIQIVHDIAQSTPRGMVVFMQSYKLLVELEKFVSSNTSLKWEKQLVWDNNKKKSNPFEDYQRIMQQNRSGAILFSVVGGTLSEGINFSDDLCRAVVLLGVPYPNFMSVEIQEQLKHQRDSQSFYDNLAMKGVNQSIGRAIRHIKDYALLYLVDQKFTDKRLTSKLSSWLHSRISIVQTKEVLIQQTNQFFYTKQ